jgi:outer membrane protein, multidrug efflux system
MKILHISLIALLVILFSCKTTEKNINTQTKTPDNYYQVAKTEKSIAIEKPSEFFKDKFLITLIDSALKYNFDLLSMNLQSKEFHLYFKQSKNAFLPSLAANTSIGQRKFGFYTMDGIGNYDTQFSPNLTREMQFPEHLPDYYLGAQSSWEIDIWGKLKNQKKAALNRYMATEEARKLLVTEIVAEVSKAYYELLTLDQELLIIRENNSLLERALEIVKIQKEAGKATSFNVKQTEAQLFNSKSLESLKIQRILEVENYLNALSGSYPKTIERSEPILKQTMLTEIETGLPTDLINNRPDITKSRYELNAYIADIKSSRAAMYPNLTLNASIGLQAFNSALLFQTPSLAYSLFGNLLAPIFQRKTLKTELKRNELKAMTAQYQYQKTVLNAYNEVVNNYNKIKNLDTHNNLKRQEIASLTDATAISNELYLTGQLYYLDVILARKMVLDAQISLSENKKEQFFALIDLYRSLGGGWR